MMLGREADRAVLMGRRAEGGGENVDDEEAAEEGCAFGVRTEVSTCWYRC